MAIAAKHVDILEGTSEDPGAFTSIAEQWVSFTACVPGSGVDAGVPFVSQAGTVAETGATIPLYASIRESAFYNASLDTTFFAWEAWDTDHREAQISSYNHTSGTFGSIVDAGITMLSNDDHGVPAIVQDHEGYLHLFGGSHIGSLQYASTDSANDISAWTVRTALSAATSYSYPHPVLVDGAIYLFTREGLAQGMDLVLTSTSALADGVATWNSPVQLIDLDLAGPTLQRVYAGNFIVVSTEIWFVATRSPQLDTSRNDIYFFKYETTTGDVKNWSETVTIDAGDLPVDRTEADADFRIYQHLGSEEGCDIPAWLLNGSNPHIFFCTGEETGADDDYDVLHMWWTGSAWDSEVVAQVAGRYDVVAPLLLSDGSIQLYYPDPWWDDWRDLSFPVDGEPMLVVRSSGGSWGSPQKILQGEASSVGRFTPIWDGHDNARVLFCELADGNTDSLAGDKRCFIYGDSGFLARP